METVLKKILFGLSQEVYYPLFTIHYSLCTVRYPLKSNSSETTDYPY